MKSDKLKILHVLGGLNIGGAETMVMNLYENIDRNKFEFDFIIHTEEKQYYEEYIEKLGGKIYHIPRYKVYNHFSYKKAWEDFFKEHQEYRIVHGHVRSTASIYLKIAKKYGLKTISHSHSTSNGKGLQAIIKKILQYRIRYIADYFMGCSKEANIWLFGKKTANSNRCFIINNAIDYSKFKFNSDYCNEIRKKYNIEKNEILLGHVGRFIDAKNHKYLIDILERLLLENKKFKLMLCGDGELKDSIKHYAQKKEIIKNILFIDANTEIYKYYSAFDIFLFPSKYEGLGIAAIEAQVAGLPVILSNNIPKNVKISENIRFLNIDMESINDWVKSIMFIANNLKKNEIIVSNDYNIKKTIGKLEKLYIKIGAFNENKE